MDGKAVSALMPGLAPQGRLLVLGVGQEPLAIMPGMLVGGERMVQGTITGSAYEAERTLDFSVLTGVRAWITTLPLQQAVTALDLLRSGQPRFRIVFTMASSFVAASRVQDSGRSAPDRPG